ncbi:MAG: Na+/H+ antiporter NhaC family protein [Bacteroidales bacterium]|nr:Na+/H+ antiporter NhaC family protein [Candidatus Cacconaster merdequi]
MERISHKKGLKALSPLVVFLLTYLVSSIVAGDFYKVPVASAFLVACIYAVIIAHGTLTDKIETFSKGAGNSNVLLMVWIFILAGAFAGTARDIGAIDATVAATLNVIPSRMLYAGFFLIACFISMSIGTSVGTIVALVPIATGIALHSGTSTAMMAGVIVGGSFFGDNLSFISDTTIASTRAVGCEMRDKFKTNIKIILPAVIAVTILYLIKGQGVGSIQEHLPVNYVKLVPYLIVIALALSGRKVTVVLTIGIAANMVIGFIYGDFTWTGWLASAGSGIAGMNDLIVITLLAGGLLEIIRQEGGLDYIIYLLTRRIRGRRGAQLSIAALVCLANLCTANNTIAIITTGGIAKDITDRFHLDPRHTASILDTFSCLIQGIIPYGAQVLMAAGLASVSPTEILQYLYYPMLMGLCALAAIIICPPKSRRKTA